MNLEGKVVQLVPLNGIAYVNYRCGARGHTVHHNSTDALAVFNTKPTLAHSL